MAAEIKRMRYFNGLFLKEDEFKLEQEYNVRLRRIHNRRSHTWGIVYGLDIVLGSSDREIVVRQGMALDQHFDTTNSEEVGREIVLSQDQELDLSIFAGGDQVWVWVRYDEQEADVVPEKGGSQPIHTLESAAIEVGTTEPADPAENILLGRVDLKTDGSVDLNSIVTVGDDGRSLRIPSGIAGGRGEFDVLTLRDEGVAGNFASLEGELFDDGDIGILAHSQHTRFLGRVSTSGDFAAEGIIQADGLVQAQGGLQIGTAAAITEITNDPGLSGDSDARLPTEQAVRGYVAAALEELRAEQAGMVAAFAAADAPDGWLICDGAEISRVDYARLFARIGTVYGAGDGSTTFNLPDLRGEFIRGFDDGRGVDAGRAFGSAQTDQLQSHKHDDAGHTHAYTQNVPGWGASFQDGATDGSTIGNTGSGSANLGDPTDSGTGAGTPRHGTETRPRNLALNYCIKY